ncbi:MAG: SEC-C domain-containing protein [Oligoflexia bacterium]|nr:SEC-C domain-containing protein [Oligoflexia bacterium]
MDTKKKHKQRVKNTLTEQTVQTAPIVPVNKNVGRNDPCPCGSGLKFKKCCLK